MIMIRSAMFSHASLKTNVIVIYDKIIGIHCECALTREVVKTESKHY